MSLAQALSLYTSLNVAIAAAVIGLAAVEAMAKRIESRTMLRLHYCVAALLVVVVVTHSILPQGEFIQPSAKVWSTLSIAASATHQVASDNPAHIEFGAGAYSYDTESIAHAWIGIALVLFGLGALRLGRDIRALNSIKRRAYLTRRIARVSIWVSDGAAAPFSFWMPGGGHVVIPTSLVEKPNLFRMAIAHELQHHRQKDTLWLYFFLAVRLTCILNPLAHRWNSKVSSIQEFACDEAVLMRRRWSVKQYARWLFEVARSAKHLPNNICTTALIVVDDRHSLQKRIEKMLQPKNATVRGSMLTGIVISLFALMMATSYAAGGWVQDGRVTLAQAHEMAKKVPPSEFPIVINDEVLHELNRYAGTAEGREFMRESLQRMNAYRGIVSTTLARYDVPAAFLAMPLVESGYRNLDQSHNLYHSAGLWQFIPRTARAYGLRVDAQTDERLDAERLTDAAARLLESDRLRFEDWQLAAMAFNMGEAGVQEAIDRTGSRDAWELVRAGQESDKGYLARIHAAVLIMANPDSVE